METLDTVAVIIGAPIVLLIAYGVGLIARSVIFKETEYSNHLGNIILNIIIGVVVILILGKLFEGCNQGDENENLWRR